MNKIWLEVKENNRKLEACVGPHDFIDTTPDKVTGRKYKCSKCEGSIDSIAFSWYNKGLEHGKIKE
jgi:hypothetical protein